MRVFVSSQSVDHAPASDLILRLREMGAAVSHSPSNPLDRDDPQWIDWYAVGLPAAIEQCDTVVIVVDRGWDSSSWMAQEAQVAVHPTSLGTKRRLYFWNPGGIVVVAAGMLPYLQSELPRSMDAAVQILLG